MVGTGGEADKPLELEFTFIINEQDPRRNRLIDRETGQAFKHVTEVDFYTGPRETYIRITVAFPHIEIEGQQP